MNSQKTHRSITLTALVLAAAASLWAILAVLLVVVVPRYERAFQNQGLQLPAPTQWAVAAGRWAGDYWYILPLFGLFVLPAVLLLTWLVRHRVAWLLPGRLWFTALIGVPLLLSLGGLVGPSSGLSKLRRRAHWGRNSIRSSAFRRPRRRHTPSRRRATSLSGTSITVTNTAKASLKSVTGSGATSNECTRADRHREGAGRQRQRPPGDG